MKTYRLLSILFLVIFLGGGRQYCTGRPPSGNGVKESEACKMVLPEAERFSEKFKNPPHYKAYKTNPQTGQEELVGVAFVTTDIVPNIKGYAGPIRLMAGVTPDGKINALHVLFHSETPQYVFSLPQFISQFSGLTVKNTFQLGKDIDGITQATITSDAIARSVRESLKIIARDVLKLEAAPKTATQKTAIALDQIIMPVLIFGVAVLGFVFLNNILRWAALLSGLVYLGFIKKTMVSVVQVANIGLLKFPDFAISPLWYLLVGLTVLSSIVLGMVYCGGLCPFATAQELLRNTFKKIRPGKKAFLFSGSMDGPARYVKYGVLFTALIASLIVGNSGPANVEPFLTFFTRHGSTLGCGFLILILLVSLFHFRFWCKYLCPIGAVCGLLAEKSLFTIKLGESCDGCRICDDICPVEAITMGSSDKPVIDYPECILCGKCIEQCPQKTLQLGWRHDRKT